VPYFFKIIFFFFWRKLFEKSFPPNLLQKLLTSMITNCYKKLKFFGKELEKKLGVITPFLQERFFSKNLYLEKTYNG